MARGRFITLEGGEGTGKTTQVERLAAALDAIGVRLVRTREPGGSATAEAIRSVLLDDAATPLSPLTEAMLHFAARRDHLEATIWPALDAGAWVLCDRFADSTRAYQGDGLGLGRETIEDLYRLTMGSFAPDLTLIIDLPVEEGLARAARRCGHEDRYQRRDTAFHARVRAGFLAIAAAEPGRCAVVDGTGDEATVAARIRRAVAVRLGVPLPPR